MSLYLSSSMESSQIMSSQLNKYSLTSLIILSIFICGCGQVQQGRSKSNQPLLETIFSGLHGPSTDQKASIKWVTNFEQFRAIVEKLGKLQFSDNPLPVAEVDFDRYWALLIEMGQKPTGGYSVSLNKFSSHISNKSAVIHLNWNIPDEGAMVTQMVTSPYLMLRLSKSEFKKVVVVDQDERTLFSVDVPR